MREATKEERESVNNYIKSISQKAIIIPEGATNGDMVRALFPNAKIYQVGKYVNALFQSSVWFEDMCTGWWYAPYKKEGDEE